MSKTPCLTLQTIAAFTLMFLFNAMSLAQSESEWRTPSAENTVYLDTPDGRLVIELNEQFAPKTVEQFKRLIRKGFYKHSHFYRVIDGFVAQGGDPNGDGSGGITGANPNFSEDMDAANASVATMAALSPQIAAFGHGGPPVMEDVTAKLAAIA